MWATNVNYCLLELTDTDREGDNFKDVLPDRMKQCDGSKNGPWFAGFETKAQAMVFVAQVGPQFLPWAERFVRP